MTHLDQVTAKFDDLQYMRPVHAEFLRDFISTHDARDILEVGFYHGKSSACIAAILEDLGRGHLVTLDLELARTFDPNIHSVLDAVGLAHRVTPVYAQRSYTWEMAKMITATPRPQFDLCYFDGDHTWDGTGYGFVLVDMLLRPGGWIIFDDLNWTLDEAIRAGVKGPKSWRQRSRDEQTTPAVRLVFDTLIPHFGYTDLQTAFRDTWAIARKPLDAVREPTRAYRPGIAARLATRIRNTLRRRQATDIRRPAPVAAQARTVRRRWRQ